MVGYAAIVILRTKICLGTAAGFFFLLSLFLVAVGLSASLTAQSQSRVGKLKVDETRTELEASGDYLILRLPIIASEPNGSAQVSVELLDTLGLVVSRGTASCALSAGTHVCSVELPSFKVEAKSSSERDLFPLYRLRYIVKADVDSTTEGILPLDGIAPDLFELHVAAPKYVRPGAHYVALVRAIHPLSQAPRANIALDVSLEVSYTEDEKKDAVFAHNRVKTDSEGFASIPFTVPDGSDISSVDVNVSGIFANVEIGTNETLTVPTNPLFELTTDKPLYQPGQTVHTRMLLLDRNAHATAGTTVRVDVRDPNETLVYRGTAVTSAFGIATVDWEVPARTRLGEYDLEATLPDDATANQSASATVRISRYDLPTFVVAPTPDSPFYLPGNNAVVEVRANYLFGKPVPHGHVRVVREDDRTWNFAKQRYDVKEGRGVSGELDAHGVFKAHIDLTQDEKRYRNLDPSNATEDVHFAAYVSDASTGRTEQRRFDLRIASQPMNIYVTASQQAKGLPQGYFASVTTADGQPAECDLAVSLLPASSKGEAPQQRIARALLLDRIHTDANGLARISLPTYAELVKRRPVAKVGGASDETDEPVLLFRAQGRLGQSGLIEQALPSPAGMLRVDTPKTIYRPGDPIAISIDSAEPALPLRVQVLRHTRRGDVTLDTRDIILAKGHAELTVASDSRYTGLVFVNVVAMGTKANTSDADSYGNMGDDSQTALASHALLFPRDNSLHVGITMSADTYSPGSEAIASLTVRGPQDLDGDDVRPVPSALGLVAVDQAVQERNRSDSEFGGADSQPFFFHMNFGDSGSVGGFTLSSLERLDAAKALPPGAQLAAEILLASEDLRFETSNNSAPSDLAGVYRVLLDSQLNPARLALTRYLDGHAELPTTQRELAAILRETGIDFLAQRDPWGETYTLVARPNSDGVMRLNLVSDGPDKQHGTSDDFEVELATWRWFKGHSVELRHAVEAYHQRTGGYIRTLRDLRAEMQVEGIAFDTWRDPWNQPLTYRFGIQQTRFTVDALTSGDPAVKPRYAWESGPYVVESAGIDYTNEIQQRLNAVLNDYSRRHPFPRNRAELQAALGRSGMSLVEFRDPWHHLLYPVFRSHSFFSDRVRTEVHAATPDAAPESRTTIVPVTAISDMIELRSPGPDGKSSTYDDFTYATFSRVRSTQSAQDGSPRPAGRGSVQAGPTGDISGVVSDQTGAIIPRATVTATNAKSGVEFETQTDNEGSYLLGPIPFGTYKLRFRLAGFTDLVYDQVVVSSNGILTLDAKLNVGSASETVEVTAGPPPVMNTESATVTVSADKVANLPLNKNVSDLVMLAPGLIASGAQPTATPRLREYFPETLLWRPEVITAPDGTATVHFPVADNITTWQFSAAASTVEGNVGSGTAQFATFQPFFSAFDPPPVLTVGDRISLPVTLRNYLDHAVSVESAIAPASWFHLDGPATQTTRIESQRSASPVFRFTAEAPVTDARQEFTAKASDAGDRISRPVTVHPNGQESAVATAAILTPGETTLLVTLPPDTLPGSARTTLKLYPNLGAHLRDAIQGMVAYPGGCGEQILSIAWPSLLMQRYTANLPVRDDKLRKQTHRYLEQAYQNLLANQLPSGGFVYWPRDTNADIALTAYAVEFLKAAGEFITVDPKVVNGSIAWLGRQQQKDGRWLKVDFNHKQHAEDNHGNAMLTASVAAMIAGAPGSEPMVRKALKATQSFIAEFDEPYTLASYALAATALHDTPRSEPAINRLRGLALSENGGAYWSLETNTPFFGWGRAGRVETSAQVLRALIAAGATPDDDLVTRGLLFLDHEQDRHSLWYSTQATARVLDVLAEIALRRPAAPANSVPGSISVRVDGQQATSIPLPPASLDGGPIFVPLCKVIENGPHRISVTMPPASQAATAQVVANFYRRWPVVPAASAITNHEQLRLSVVFSSRRPTPGQAVTVDAHIERVGFAGYGMMIAEIGLPPGADVDRASLESAMSASDWQLNHYEVLPDRVLIYVWPRAGGLTLRFRFSLRYSLDALTAPSTVYDYYNPEAHFDLVPTRFIAGRAAP